MPLNPPKLITSKLRPRIAKDGCLYWTEPATKKRRTWKYRAHPWPWAALNSRQGIEYQDYKGRWRPLWEAPTVEHLPGTCFVLFDNRHERHRPKALKEFLQCIPPEVAELAPQFPAEQIAVLKLLSDHPDLIPFFAAQPMMAYILVQKTREAFYWEQVGWSSDLLAESIRKGTKHLAQEWLGLQSKAQVKLLRKVRWVEEYKGPEHHRKLLEAIKAAQGEKLFAHLPSFTSSFLFKFCKQPLKVSFGVQQELAEMTRQSPEKLEQALDRVKIAIQDTLEMAEQLGEESRASSMVEQFPSVFSLEQLHDRYDQRLKRRQRNRKSWILSTACDSDLKHSQAFKNWWRAHEAGYQVPLPPFPKPPLEGTEQIQPIRTPDQLAQEGREMRHCVAIYTKACYLGECYIYRVLGPERATLEVVPDERGGWRVGQAYKASNRLPNPQTMESLRQWAEEAPLEQRQNPTVDVSQ